MHVNKSEDLSTSEKHANDFMLYVAEHEEELKNAIKKNITYDDDIFDDVTANTTLRIAEYIINNKANIKSFKNLSFRKLSLYCMSVGINKSLTFLLPFPKYYVLSL